MGLWRVVETVLGRSTVLAVGGYHIYKGASRNFLDDLKGDSSDLVRRLGTVGTSPKDWSSSVPGFWSSSRRVDRSRTRAPVSTGPWSLPRGGMITYGFCTFAMTRYTRM